MPDKYVVQMSKEGGEPYKILDKTARQMVSDEVTAREAADSTMAAQISAINGTLTDYGVKSLMFRGTFSDLGYSSIAQCLQNGFYLFSSSDSISDLPDGWIGGGIVEVHANGTTRWQEVLGTVHHAVRYGTSAGWTLDYSRRGTIQQLGYTALSQCSQPGYYTFTSSDAETISDLPAGWFGGGLLRVYIVGNSTWQELIANTQHFVRYGTNGLWNNRDKYIYAKYFSGSGDDSSDAQIEVTIPKQIIKSPSSIVYVMGHCVDNNVKANVWRVMYQYQEASGNRRKLTLDGEWECALHLAGRDDFSGGITHGDEIDQNVSAFVDGRVTSLADIEGFCEELKIVRNSILYDPADHTTAIAEHGVEYRYTLDGLTIRQSIKWLVAENLTQCFLAMLPIIKAYSTERYSDVDFEVVTNDSSAFPVTIPGAKAVAEYNEQYDTFTEMAAEAYPQGMTGGDCALITDNGGRGYNKVYLPVCTSGASQIGEIWKSTTVYKGK